MKKYWFRKRSGLFSKDLGYGWVPISWQGCLVVMIFIAITTFSAFYFDLNSGTLESILKFMATLISCIILMIIIAKFKTKNDKKERNI